MRATISPSGWISSGMAAVALESVCARYVLDREQCEPRE